MTKIAMYTSNQLFGHRKTGGLKRFIELYYGLINKGFAVDLYCTDTSEVLRDNNLIGYSLTYKDKSKSILIPTELKLLISNLSSIKKIKKKSYDQIIVFDVPTAIGLCLGGVRHIQLFIRQDLIEYKKISIKERTKNKLVLRIYLAFMKFCETICLLRAERIIIQCKYDYNALIKRHRLIKRIIKQKSIIQINNVNPSWIVKKSAIANQGITDNIIKSNANSFVVGFIGDFSNERKGHRIFVDAIKKLINKGLSLEAVLVGDGKQLQAYKEECSDYPTIKYTGRLENPMIIIKQCDLIVVPSLADSCPNTVMEALYNEIPVIGARSGGIPEILRDENSLFEPNVHSLQSRIEHFFNRDNLLELKNKQRIRKKELEFDWPAIMIKHLQIKVSKLGSDHEKNIFK